MPRSLQEKLGLHLLFALVLLSSGAGLLWHSRTNVSRNVSEAIQTLEAQGDLIQLHNILGDIQNGTRGYLVTGREETLKIYDDARASLPDAVSLTRTKAAGTPLGQSLSDLEEAIGTELRHREELIRTARDQGLDAARALMISSGIGAGIEAIRDSIDRLVIEAGARYVQQVEARNNAIQNDQIALVVVGLLVVGVLLTAFAQQSSFLSKLLRTRDTLLHSEAKLSATLASMREGVLTTDPTGLVNHLNRAGERLTGWTESEACGRPVGEVIRLADEHTGQPIGIAAPADAVSPTSRPVIIDRAGERHAVEQTAAEMRGADGGLRGVVYCLHDVGESRREEAQRRVAADRLSIATRAANIGIWDWDVVNDRLAWDETMHRLYGIGSDEFGGNHDAWLSRLHPDDRQKASEDTQRALRGEEDYDATFRAVRPDGSVQTIKGAALIERAADGTPLRMVGSNLDITSQLRMEQSQQILESAPDAMVITDRSGRIVRANAQVETLFGYKRDELTGQPVEVLLPEVSRAAHAAFVEGFVQHPLPRPMGAGRELFARRRDGSEFPVEISLSPIVTRDGTLISSAIRDITDRRKSEAALRDREERLRLIFESSFAAVALLDTDMRYLLVSERWRTDFQLGDRNLIGQTYRDTFPEIPESWEIALEQRVLAGEVVRSEEEQFVRIGGTIQWIRWEAHPWHKADGTIGGIAIFSENISARKMAEEQLRQAQKMEAVGQLAGGIAHDFNNILMVILGNSELLVNELSESPEAADLARMTMSAAQRGAELTGRLLTFSRRQPLQSRQTDVGALVEGMTGMLRRSLGTHINLLFSRPDHLWESEVDPGQLENAVLNLCLNARDAMLPKGGHLTIETGNAHLDEEYSRQHFGVGAGDYVQLAVTDTGCGMTREVLDRVFEPFFTTKPLGLGSGLGMSMVFGFVKQSHGHIAIYSEPGHGTTVRIYLPRSSGTPEPEFKTPSLRLASGERILAVEDDPLVRTLIERNLKGLGYSVIIVTSGEEALQVLSSDPTIDLLFTDIVMPGGMNGRQLADAAWQSRPGLPVLFSTGFTETAVLHQGTINPGMHLLQKPYIREELAEKVWSALRRA